MIHCFDPIAGPDARVLVLGTVPGQRSLDEDQYYAHSRNAFWSIMQALFAGGAQLDYPSRIEMLVDTHVAVWDVLRSVERNGSLDSRDCYRFRSPERHCRVLGCSPRC